MTESALLASQVSGWCAVFALVLALSATPVARVVASASRSRRARMLGAGILASRRRFGIACAAIASVHAGIAIALHLGADAWGAIRSVAWLRSGALALALLLPLLVTSYPSITRALRIRLWKPLHRLAHVAAILVVHHLLLSPFAPRAWVLALAAVLVLGAATRALPRRERGSDPA